MQSKSVVEKSLSPVEPIIKSQLTEQLAKARGSLLEVSKSFAWGLIQDGWSQKEAVRRALNPDLVLVWEVSADNCLNWIVQRSAFDQAQVLTKNAQWVEKIPMQSDGLLCLWVLEDSSAVVHWSGAVQQLCLDILGSMLKDEIIRSNVPEYVKVWEGPFGKAVGERIFGEDVLQGTERKLLYWISPKELEYMSTGIRNQYKVPKEDEWEKGLVVKSYVNGNIVTPKAFEEIITMAMNRNKAFLKEFAQRRLDEIKKVHESKLKAPWHDTVVEWIKNIDAPPIYDGGLVGFLMSKPNLYGQYPKSYWQKALVQIHEVLRPLKEGESPEIDAIVGATSHLGSDVSTQIAHFMYRYHRSGGAKSLAHRVLEQNKMKVVEESKVKTGLAALINKKEDPVSEESREATRAASSIEFAVQYGSAMALNTALWGLETAFQNPELQARVYLRSMRGAGEISLESFGWFARLMFELSDGFLTKQIVEEVLMSEMEKVSALAEELKARGGKIGLENEWSGKWGLPLARRKVREYLGLVISEKSGSSSINGAKDFFGREEVVKSTLSTSKVQSLTVGETVDINPKTANWDAMDDFPK